MRLIIQRVTEASVTVNQQIISKIGKGVLVLLGIHVDDDQVVAKKLALKLPKIKIWDSIVNTQNDEEKKEDKLSKPWSASVADNNYEILVVSQFTLYHTMKGNKPDFHHAKNANDARILYEYFMEELRKGYKKEKIQGGKFQEKMMVQLINDGPVTIELEEMPQQNGQKKDKKKVQPQQQLEQQEES